MAEQLIAQLLDAGLVTQAQVRASKADSPFLPSSRVVQNLVASGLDERVLAGFFVSLGLGPMLQTQELVRADEDLVRRLPGSLAHELCALPLRASPAGAIVAMADPTDKEAAAKLSDALGGGILPTVAKFSDLVAALENAYPTDRPTLVSDPLALTRKRHPSGVIPRGEEAVDPKLEDLASTASAVWDRAWDQTIGGPATVSPPPPVAPEPVTGSPDIDPHLAELGGVTTRDEVVRVGCEACLAVARGAAFLALRKGVFRGWDGAGEGITSGSIRSLWVPATNPSVLNDVLRTGEVFHGPYGHTAADHLFRAALGSGGREVVIAPVLIGTRMCGLLCASDPGPDPSPIEAVADSMGRAFQRLIVSRKSEAPRIS